MEIEKILSASKPEDIFGAVNGSVEDKLKTIKRIRNMLAARVHPDVNKDPDAAKAFHALTEMFTLGQKFVNEGVYGQRRLGYMAPDSVVPDNIELEFNLKSGEKLIRYAPLCSGDVADLHRARIQRGRSITEVIIKVPIDAADNDLIQNEAYMLREMATILGKMSDPHIWKQLVPTVFETMRFDDGKAGRKPKANVLTSLTDWYSVNEIRTQFPGGVDTRTLVWMFKRLLTVVNLCHDNGIVHGAILPPHVLYYPDNDGGDGRDIRKHAIRLVDWCYAVRPRDGNLIGAWVPEYELFYPPEVKAKKTQGVWTDLYMAAKTMVYLAGGEPGSDDFPSHIERPVAHAVQQCLIQDASARVRDPKKYFSEFVRVLERVYGAPRYHPFHLTHPLKR